VPCRRSQGTASFTDVLNGATQTLARGPIGFMEAIKQLGTNGGGFLDQNSATPFENPTGLTNFLSIYLLLVHSLCPHLHLWQNGGQHQARRGLLAAMLIIFATFAAFTINAEHGKNPAVAAAGIHSTGGQHRRQGDTLRRYHHRALCYRVHQTSTGSADASYDSFTPMADSDFSPA
jgi:K+-transporting ATPase ATPase A chain